MKELTIADNSRQSPRRQDCHHIGDGLWSQQSDITSPRSVDVIDQKANSSRVRRQQSFTMKASADTAAQVPIYHDLSPQQN